MWYQRPRPCQTDNNRSLYFRTGELKMFHPSYIILKILRLEGKQCETNWGGSKRATSSGSTLFANSRIFNFNSSTVYFVNLLLFRSGSSLSVPNTIISLWSRLLSDRWLCPSPLSLSLLSVAESLDTDNTAEKHQGFQMSTWHNVSWENT